MAKKVAAAAGPIEGPWLLPEGWRWRPLGDLGEFLNGAAFKPSDWGESGTPIIRIQNLNNPNRIMNRTTRTVNERLMVRSGDILVSWSATLDAFLWRREDAWLNQHIFKVLPDETLVDSQYMFFLLKNEIENLKKTEHLHGSTMMHINRGPFLAHLVPIPPLETQVQVAARIGDLFTEIEDGEMVLARAEDDIAIWRKALLNAAVAGELTADWRDAYVNTETGIELFARISAERRIELKKKGKQSFDQSQIKNNSSSILPEGWARCGPSQIIEWSSGKFMPDRLMSGGNVPVYGGNGIAGYHDEALVDTSTLVIGRVGHYCGNAYTTDGAAWISDNAIYASRVATGVAVDYLRLVFEQINLRRMAQGGAQPFVSQALLNSISIPLPSAEEQCAILAIVKINLAEASEFERLVKEAKAASELLRQSILAAAFRGELT